MATGALGWAAAVAVEAGAAALDAGALEAGVEAAGLDATGAFEVQAVSTAVTAQAAPRVAIVLKVGIIKSFR
ncbi:MAG TPA: hypothetical protein VI365_32600 [Trebonia sp.]